MSHHSAPPAAPARVVSRRSVAAAAAWVVPVVAVAVATPSAAASLTDLRAFQLTGTCGTLGVVGPGFRLTAATVPLPVGTTVIITGSGVRNIGVFSSTGDATATVMYLGPTSRQAVLTSELPAGGTMFLRTTLSISVPFVLNAVASPPDDAPATGAKTTAVVTSTLIDCTGA
ncbi:hypothetical protein GRS96_17140 [Rathayibacter sp. VKM Ac-2803]|uniref:hypothetical protein n=1 Tax=Rathayibacter sp. VKM Ac-2803 TaxID=2609256 RepID=UPI00135CB0DD|nr:hypothetical protein [Rathayibacter sp. VKM Ac-2803]MWV50996.1 hypothetical protein [Rathayibacter sp. VKM Ac-2803]